MRLWSKKQQPTVPARRRERDAVRATRATEADLESRYAFRRNRTITGSLVSEVGSATESTAQLKSTRVQAHDLRKHRRRLAWALAGIATLAGGFSFLVWDSIITPRAVAAPSEVRALLVDPSSYDKMIQAYLSKHPNQRFRFSLQRDQLAAYLQANGFPEVSSVDDMITPDGFGTKRLVLHMRRPTVAWTTGKTELFVDSTGVAFERNYYDTPAVAVVDQSGIQAKDNQVLVSNRFLAFIGRLMGAIEAHGQHVIRVAIPANTTRQVEMVLADVAYPIKVSVDRPVGEQAEDSVRAVEYMKKHGVTPEYIDVRVSGRAYYK